MRRSFTRAALPPGLDRFIRITVNLIGAAGAGLVAEERLLSGSAGYRAYQQRVRWRMIPGLWR